MQSSVRAGQQKLEMTHRFWRMHFQESFTWGVIPKAIYWSQPTGAHAQRTHCGMAFLHRFVCKPFGSLTLKITNCSKGFLRKNNNPPLSI